MALLQNITLLIRLNYGLTCTTILAVEMDIKA
jgi:hypothetical protein